MTAFARARPVLFGLLALLLPAVASAAPAPAGTEAELRALTQQLLDAIAPGQAEVWDRYLDPDMIQVDENGTIHDKAQLLAELRPLPPGLVGSLHIDTFRVRLHGDTAVVAHEDQEQLDYFGQRLHSRFRSLDVWRRKPAGWRLIGQQISAVLRDPPAIALSRDALCAYNGSYRLTADIAATIACEPNGLVMRRTGRPDAHYRAEARDVFFVPGRPRTRRLFQRDSTGEITGFVDRREGEDIVWHRAG